MYQLGSNIVSAGQFKQFVQVSAPALQSITRKIAAIKNCEVAGWQNVYELINSLYFRMKCKQRYAYNQHLYKKIVDPFAWASSGYFLPISLWACAAGWGGIFMVGSTMQGCIKLYLMTELEGRTGKYCPEQETNIFPSRLTSLFLVTRVLSYPSLRSERFVGEDAGDEVESDNKQAFYRMTVVVLNFYDGAKTRLWQHLPRFTCAFPAGQHAFF